MVLRTIGQCLLPGEKRRYLNLGSSYGTKSLRLEKKLAHKSTDRQSRLFRNLSLKAHGFFFLRNKNSAAGRPAMKSTSFFLRRTIVILRRILNRGDECLIGTLLRK